ncbi:hypothetical protein B0T20DRAFT_497581 [Sordaria brevicollis]|uniref:Phosphodiesterase n=1 Tax=Sordaria brevicollis TaxID=83679 RepID=A0AAE0PG64_SORBR|nr:hypothetical protein B0T20DRAFT_497581 [Sordaria brevicollis]
MDIMEEPQVAMEDIHYRVIFVNRSISEDRCIQRNARHLDEDLDAAYLCSTEGACMSHWLKPQEDHEADLQPTIILLDTPYQQFFPARFPNERRDESHDGNSYGLSLLKKVESEARARHLYEQVIPVPLIQLPDTMNNISGADRTRMRQQCIDFGAKAVLSGPLNAKSITVVQDRAYHAYKDALMRKQALADVRKGRKRSLIAVFNDTRPYGYLREYLVESLIKKICSTEDDRDDEIYKANITVSPEKRAEISRAISTWHFDAHKFDYDELIVAAELTLNHALSMPELKAFRISPTQLHNFLKACRAAYMGFVPYHNFRHVIDVLQATFHQLLRIGALPPYPNVNGTHPTPIPEPSATPTIGPEEAFTLLLTAIGHDVLHPGVNNGFLIEARAPLAELYNDRSVLENFHSTSYCQILKRHWPIFYENRRLRTLMISCILATDMALHFDYMAKLGNLQKLRAQKPDLDGWNEKAVEEARVLVCALVIKCADISNVARRHDIGAQWMHLLNDELILQTQIERDMGQKTALVAPPSTSLDGRIRSQLKFMELFAFPLFRGVADILPGLQFSSPPKCDAEPPTEKSALNGRPNGVLPSLTTTDFSRGGVGIHGANRQRCSEATEGSSAPCSGEWGSQANSATTGKMPLSPSTQGTSIISRDSMDKSAGVPVTTVTAPDSPTAVPDTTKVSSDRDQLQVNEKIDHFVSDDEDNMSNGHRHMNGSGSTLEQDYLKPEQENGNGKTIKKKASLMGLKNKFSSKFSSFTKSKKGKTSCPASPERSADSMG